MPRPRQRACLQVGLKLDLDRLARHRFIARDARSGPVGIRWTHSYWGEIASDIITADLSSLREGWLRLQSGNLDQRIVLIVAPRHFGGYQWYFICPVRSRSLPCFGSRQEQRGFAAARHGEGKSLYQSQFCDVNDRAYLGKARIKARLIGEESPDDWDLPPKPRPTMNTSNDLTGMMTHLISDAPCWRQNSA
jgi:hypothetical protein